MTTEHDKLRAAQEAKSAAELKAKLDMVEVQSRSKYGRQHRKIGEMVCNTGVKTGYREAVASFVLRLNSISGDFIAEYGDVQYVSRSREALQAKMNEVARVALDLKWSRYLHVEYKATVPWNGHWNSVTTLGIDSPRRKDNVVYGIELTWEVVEYSDAIQLPGQGERFMKRDVDEKGKPCGAQETVPALPDGLVPYTKEREEVLLRLRAALAGVDAKMVELFRGAPDRVARMLDSAGSGALLLEVPRGEPKKSKR